MSLLAGIQRGKQPIPPRIVLYGTEGVGKSTVGAYPPSVNHYWRRVGQRTLISREGRRFRRDVMAILAAMGVEPLAGKLLVRVVVFPPDNRRRDLDNLMKGLLDALEHGGAYHDDGQIVKLIIKKGECVEGGKTHVRIQEVRRR